MEKVKKVISEEVVAVNITEEEFAQLAAEECTKVLMDSMSDDDDPVGFSLYMSMTCAKYAAHLMDRIFHNDEKEESEDK